MALNEADTRAKLIDPAIHKRGWTEDLIRREETAGSIEIIGGKARRRSRGKVDYVLRVKVNPNTQPVAMALIEAKKDTLPPGHGLDQGKGYAECKRLNVPFLGHACPMCSNKLRMVQDGKAVCPSCQTEVDPTVYFQSCQDCGGALTRGRSHYSCERCGKRHTCGR